MGHVTVEVDRAAILADVAAVASEAPAAATAPTDQPAAEAPATEAPIAPEVTAEQLRDALRFMTAAACSNFAPAWRVTAEESASVADASALVLQYWMPPGAVDPKYVALFALAGAIYAVASKRRDDEGNWLPLREKKRPAPAPVQAPAPMAPLRV